MMESRLNSAQPDFENVFTRGNEYFLNQFHLIKAGDRSDFNWSAFLFGAYYFVYRKMYVQGFLALAATLFSIQLIKWTDDLNFENANEVFVWLALAIVFKVLVALLYGAQANKWYYSMYLSVLKKIKSLPQENAKNQMFRNGGTSLIYLPLVFFAYLVMFILQLLN